MPPCLLRAQHECAVSASHIEQSARGVGKVSHEVRQLMPNWRNAANDCPGETNARGAVPPETLPQIGTQGRPDEPAPGKHGILALRCPMGVVGTISLMKGMRYRPRIKDQ